MIPTFRSVSRVATTLGLSLAGLLAVSLPIRGAIPSANAAALAPGAASSDAPFHLRLEKSEPSKGAVLDASPTVIRLFFSLPPEMAVTAIKLSDAADNAITLSAPRRGAGAKDPVEADVKQALAAGTYTVSWKTSSKDGHPIKGDFTFTVKSAGN